MYFLYYYSVTQSSYPWKILLPIFNSVGDKSIIYDYFMKIYRPHLGETMSHDFLGNDVTTISYLKRHWEDVAALIFS